MQAKKRVPDRLWDYGVSYVCETGDVTVSSSRYANGRTPLEIITGVTPDITFAYLELLTVTLPASNTYDTKGGQSADRI